MQIIRRAHEAASQFFLQECFLYEFLHATSDEAQVLVPLGSTSYPLRHGSVSLDQSFVADGGLHASVVVEVSDSQSVRSLHRRAVRFLTESDGGIAVVVVVKIYRQSDEGAMAVLLYRRRASTDEAVVPAEAVSFGPLALSAVLVDELVRNTGIDRKNLRGFFYSENNDNGSSAGTMRNMPDYSLVLPRNCLFDNKDPQHEVKSDWVLDLYKLQQRIVSAIKREKRFPHTIIEK